MDAQIIIIGGGCAGMQLINSLLKLPHHLTGDIILLEKNKAIAQKSWCFWTKAATEYDFLISKSWQEVQFASPQINISNQITPYSYNYINSEAFFDYHYDLIKHSNRVKVVYETVTHVTKNDDHFTVHTENKPYQSARVYNSHLATHSLAESKILLWQHFKGWFIKTEKPVFQTNMATMMDFNVAQGNAAHFMYVLPFSEQEALVEFTAFSAESSYPDEFYTEELNQYINKRWNTPFEIQKIESGKIPMCNYPFRKTEQNGVINLGSAAGAIKPTSGYAFNRIRKETSMIIESLLNPINRDQRLNNSRFVFYDELLLNIIQREPHRVPEIMQSLFSRNSFPEILAFLDEDTQITDEISIFSTLPKRLFLKQVLRYAGFR